jgi:hypothetical protein
MRQRLGKSPSQLLRRRRSQGPHDHALGDLIEKKPFALRHVQCDFRYLEFATLRITREIPVLGPRPVLSVASPSFGRLNLPHNNVEVSIMLPTVGFGLRSHQVVEGGDERRGFLAPLIQVLQHEVHSRVVAPRESCLFAGDDSGSFFQSRARILVFHAVEGRGGVAVRVHTCSTAG